LFVSFLKKVSPRLSSSDHDFKISMDLTSEKFRKKSINRKNFIT
jgi:hypothetical protein